MAKKVTLLRHGNIGFSGRYIGARDVPLSLDGLEQIAALKRVIQELKPDVVLSSPMLRCRETFDILFSDGPPLFDKDLQEIDFGRWEGLTFSEICRLYPALVESWADCPDTFSFPDGERVVDFRTRVHNAGERIAASSHENIMVITHGGVIRTLICYFLKIEPSSGLLFQIDRGRYVSLDLFSEGGVLTGLNLGAK